MKGGYRALNMGFPHEAMVDMTGGVTEVLTIATLPRDLPPLLSYLLSKGALINCATNQVKTCPVPFKPQRTAANRTRSH